MWFHVISCVRSKVSYHSNRKDPTAQIEAAEKYAKLQHDQVINSN